MSKLACPILFTALAVVAAGGTAHAQSAQSAQSTQATQAPQQIEPLVPVGPAVKPVGPAGPTVVPVIPVENLQGVETVTLDTPRGPVVVVSWPTAGPALNDDSNVNFSRLDTDRDGMLSRAEVDQAAANGGAAKRLSSRFESMDTSRDGKLSFDEAVGWVHR